VAAIFIEAVARAATEKTGFWAGSLLL